MNSDDSRSNNGSNNPVCIPNNLNHNLNSNSNCNPPEIDQNISTTTMLLNIVNNINRANKPMLHDSNNNNSGSNSSCNKQRKSNHRKHLL